MKIYRHGDVLIRETESRKKVKESNKLTLALGEVTGHHHTITGKVGLIEGEIGQDGLVFKVFEDSTLTHQEHAPLKIKKGTYVMNIEKEFDYFNQEIRRVQD